MDAKSPKKSRQLGVWVRFTISIVVAILIPLVMDKLG